MSTLDVSTTYGKIVAAFIIAVAATMLFEAVSTNHGVDQLKPEPGQPCEGTPIRVDYPYYGGMLQPHACQPQCEDQIQHYVLYTNGKATQCQRLPGCLDWGEDQGVTCVPPEGDL